MAVVFNSLRGYQRAWLRPDLVAGLTVWAVLVPESLAYATIAGVPPVVGLYAAVPALVFYAVLGSSRHLVVASMSASAALSFSIVGDFAKSGSRRLPPADRGAGSRDGRPGPGGRTRPPRLPGVVHLRARDEGLHHRPGTDHHRRTAAQAVRRPQGRRRLLPADRAPHRTPGRHQRFHPRGRGGQPRGRARPSALGPAGPGLSGCRPAQHPGCLRLSPPSARRRDRRSHRLRAPTPWRPVVAAEAGLAPAGGTRCRRPPGRVRRGTRRRQDVRRP